MRVIPAMDLLGGRVVRLRRGRYDDVTVYSDDPVETVGRFVDEGASWVHLVDLEGARDGAATQRALVSSVLARYASRVRVQVGGGVRTLEQVRAYADAGAARVVVGTRALRDPGFIAEAKGYCGVVAALDARDGRVAVEGWTVDTDVTPSELALRCAAEGASAVLYTSIARDGTGEGPDVEGTASLARALPGVEVIASGGIGALGHLRALALADGGVIASCVVGRALYERAFTLAEALSVTGTVGP